MVSRFLPIRMFTDEISTDPRITKNRNIRVRLTDRFKRLPSNDRKARHTGARTCISTSRTHSTLFLSTDAFQKAVQHHPPHPLNRVSTINFRGNASTKTIHIVYQPHATETIQMAVQLKRDSTYQRYPSAPMRDYSDSRPTYTACLLYTSPSPRDQRGSRMPSSA